MKERDYYFDNAKCALMLLVVFGHFLRPYIDGVLWVHSLYTWIFFFHMPAFIFISGYFAKKFHEHGYLQKITKKWLIPYVLFQLLYSIYYFFLYDKQSLELDLLTPHWSLWFLLSLFSWNVLLLWFGRLPKRIALPMALLLGLTGGMMEAEKWLSLSRTLTFFPFFLLGFFFQKSAIERLFAAPVRLVSLFVLVGMFFVIHFGFPDLPQDWLYGSKSYDTLGVSEPAGIASRLAIYGASLLMMFGFLSLIPSRRFSFSVLGARTFYIYILHGFILKYLHETPFPDFIMDVHGYPLLLALSVAMMLILGSKPVVRLVRPLLEWQWPNWRQTTT
ncbi:MULTISPECIES: acyltransferase family protein [Geobacillus]|uniref:Acyltransferase n=1 Tax=Geobacillus thermocatenulatus TaxID=33938 RepID=A0A226Q2E8_9BACL|nr:MULTISPECIES: acyltransferase family protein [Geobacillus]ASS99652.1 acyltransferase [Geobacillus thermocatenulatus]KLR72890.1 acyltransferase [Geobacillus sp. T6]OXB86054.1 acyltransferase [Geobacillus thermocatenulatus]RAN23277.1 acyltransferase [Geobacillus sp. A8]